MPSTGVWPDIAATLVVPIAVWLLACGFGLLVERLARTRIPNPLVIALGFCASIVVSLGIYTTGAGDAVALPVMLALAVAGFILAGRGRLGRLNAGWPLLAAIATYVLFNASVIMSGHWTFTGYNIENDSAYELLLVGHLQAYGTQALAAHAPVSTANTALSAYLATGYPLGTQSLLAVTSGILGVSGVVVWQGFISTMAAIGTLAASTLSERTMPRPLAALTGFVAMAAALTYQYALQGSIKEIGVLAASLCALAIARYALLSLRPAVGAALTAIPLAAILAVYSAAGIPYAGAIAAAALLAIPLVHRRVRLRQAPRLAASGLVTLAVCAIPVLPTLATFFNVATTGYTGSNATAPVLGPLIRPLPLSEISGVWLFGDYRFPVPPGAAGLITVIATVLIIALFAPAILRTIAAREPGPLMGAFAMGLVLLVVYPRVIPYAQAKLLAIASPLVILLAAQGLTGFRGRDWRALCALGAAGLGAAVLASDAFAYHVWPVAPTSRMLALREVGQKLGDRGPVLDSEFEQFAKYFALPAQIVDGPDAPTPISLELRHPTSEYDHSFDLDEERLSFVESFPYILTRRGPSTSRPPTNFRLIYRNAFYSLWHRTSTTKVDAHMPLGEGVSSAGIVRCRALARFVKHAPHGARLAVALPPPTYGYQLSEAAERSPGWVAAPELGDEYRTTTPGIARGTVDVARSGSYEIWVKGDLPRSVSVTLDGHTVGRATGSDTPSGWLPAGTIRVSSGSHTIGVVRGGGGLGPGNGGTQATIGAVALVSTTRSERVAIRALSDWRSLCGTRADWLELVSRAQ